jgi:hypothetical protein
VGIAKMATVSLETVVAAPWRTSVDVAFQGYNPMRDQREAFDNIVASLEHDGQLSPIHVRLVGADTYEIVDGHLVVDAARQLGMKTLEAIVHNLGDDAARLLHIHFNLNRAFQYHVKIMRLFKTVPGDNETKVATLQKCVGWPKSRISDYVSIDENGENWKYFMANAEIIDKHGEKKRLDKNLGDLTVTDWG